MPGSTLRRAALVAALAVIAIPLKPGPQALANGVPLAAGDVLVGTGNGAVGHYSSSGTLLDTLSSGTTSLNETGMCLDNSSRLRTTNYNAQSISLFSGAGALVASPWVTDFVLNPESCVVDAAQNVYVGESDGNKYITEFDSLGNQVATFSPAPDSRGSDWIDLAADQCTMFYTSEGNHVRRFNVCTNTQMADFATFANTADPCYTVRISTSGVLVACTNEVYRLSLANGSILQSYTVASVGAVSFFGLDQAPDGASFWVADPDGGKVYRIRLSDGAVLASFGASPPVGGDGLSVTVVGAPTASGGTIPPPAGYIPPTVNAGGPYGPTSEGTPTNVAGSASDPGGYALQYQWSATAPSGADVGAACVFANPQALSTSVTCNDEGVYSVTLKAIDQYGQSKSTTALTITDVAPTVSITSPAANALFATNQSNVAPVTVTASFTDVGTVDSHVCTVQWDTASPPTAGTVTEPTASSSGSCTAAANLGPGVYCITVSVAESENATGSPASFVNTALVGSASVQIVVYDPYASFVSGGGTIQSPAGALTSSPNLTGKANFGFESKYSKGAQIPTGETEFHFQGGNLNFHSTNYQWLVVAGNQAKYKGTGTVNGVSGYALVLTALDGNSKGGTTPDGFRIKITDPNGTVIYDNVPGGCDACAIGPTETIASGNIIVH